MDRDAEIVAEYEAILEFVKNFQSRKVEPQPDTKWYLFEKQGRESWVSAYKDEYIDYIRDYWVKLRGWKVTEVGLFKTGIGVTE